MNHDRERRYLEMQKYIFVLIVGMLLGIAADYISEHQDPGREVSIAARACWDDGLRAILHRDGRIECRD